MADFKETCLEYLDIDKHATFCSSETKWINKIRKLYDVRGYRNKLSRKWKCT